MGRAPFAFFFGILAAGAVACSNDGRACYPGDFQHCTCPGPSLTVTPVTTASAAPVNGYQQCDPAGSQYGACNCSGAIPGLTTGAGPGGATSAGGAPSGSGGATAGRGGAGGSGGASSGSGGAGGKLPFMSPCSKNEDCESGLCYPFPSKGPHCTKPCMTAADCPPPSPGCTPMDVCKAP